jgi:hypothetical protein
MFVAELEPVIWGEAKFGFLQTQHLRRISSAIRHAALKKAVTPKSRRLKP